MALASLRPLHSRPFALLWSAALVSNVGSWMQAVALGVLITARTHNPLWTGLVAAAAFLPNGLLAPVGGALADRLDRRRWLLLTTVAEAGCAALLAGLSTSGTTSPALLVGLAFLGGCAAAIGFPAFQAMLPDLVDKEDLLAAVSLSSAQFNLGRVVGPAAAGLAIVLGSYTLAFALNAVSFGAVVVALALLRLPPPAARPDRDSLLGQIARGARTAFAERGCRSAVLLIGLVALLASPFIALVPAMALDGLHLGQGHRGAAGTSVLVSAQGVGAVVGALTLPSLARRVGRGRLLVAALFVLPALLALYGLAPTLALGAVALVAVGGGYIGVLSGLNTVVQLRAPRAARGRVLSFFMLALGTMYPIGAVLQGALGHVVGVRAVTVGAAALLAVVLAALSALRPEVFGALGDLPAPATLEVVPASPPG
jgi:MFS family permease